MNCAIIAETNENFSVNVRVKKMRKGFKGIFQIAISFCVCTEKKKSFEFHSAVDASKDSSNKLINFVRDFVAI